jgi:hypothetical protein
MSRCIDNQEVGLEAATLERVRNSSLVECHGADNPTGQSLVPKLRQQEYLLGRGALCAERSGSGSQPWTAYKSECRNE